MLRLASSSFFIKLLLLYLLFLGNIFAMSGRPPIGGGGGTDRIVDDDVSCNRAGRCSGGCERGNQYETIQDAVDAANDGDTIKICKGSYNESVGVYGKDDLHITAASDVDTPTDVDWYSNKYVLQVGDNNHQSDDIKVDNVSFRMTSTNANYYAIRLYHGENATLENLVIDSKGGAAIYGDSGKFDGDNSFEYISINSKTSGIDIRKGKLQTFKNISITLHGTDNNYYGIRLDQNIKDKNHLFENLQFSVKKQNAILVNNGKNMQFKHIKIDATDYSDNSGAIVTQENVKSSAKLEFSDINISVNKGIGLDIHKAKDTKFDNIRIDGTTQHGIYLRDNVDGTPEFQEIHIEAQDGYGIYINKGEDVTIEDTDISGVSGVGYIVYLHSNVKGKHTFKNIQAYTNAQGIYIDKARKVKFDNITLKGSSNNANHFGIHTGQNVDNSAKVIIKNSDINVSGNALWIEKGEPDIDSSTFVSREEKVVRFTANTSDVSVKNSCIHKESTNGNSYGLYLDNNHNNAEINDNCFYGSPEDNLAWAKSNGNDFQNNFWENVTGNYNHNKVLDTATLANCPNSCGDNSSTCNANAAYEENLVVGGTAENSSDVGEWTTESGHDFNREKYSTGWAGTAPSDAGDYFFFGDNGSTTVYQTIELCNLADDIDAGLVDFNLSAYHGGFGDNDTIEIKAVFKDENGDEISSVTTNAYTSNKQMDYFEKTGGVPVNTRSVNIKLILDKKSGTDADGYSDNVSFILAENTGGNGNSDTNFKFDAWDTFRNINDRNISTKIAKKNFEVIIASLNENGTELQDFNGTVCVKLIDQNDNDLSDWQKIYFNDKNSSDQTDDGNPSFNITQSSKDSVVKIAWKKIVNENCPLQSEDNETNSRDNFSIRPQEFFISSSPSTLKAGEDFDISFIAGLSADAGIEDYNESASVSFDVNVSEQKSNCIVGLFDPSLTSSWSFEDGNGTFSTNYSEVGVVDINISENGMECTDRYAGVDCDDADVNDDWKQSRDLAILEKVASLSITAYEFNVSLASVNKDTINNFTYIAEDIEQMYVKVDVNITAQSKTGNTLKNYNSECYANNIDIKYIYTEVDDKLDNFNYLYKQDDTTSAILSETINSEVSDTIDNSFFTLGDENGSAIFTIEYNFDRNYSTTIDPFLILITELNVTDASYTDLTGSGSDDANATFYYARLKTKDIETTDDTIDVYGEIEVYDSSDSSYTEGFQQKSLNWYRMQKQTTNNEGNVTAIIPTLNSSLGTAEFSVDTIGEVGEEYGGRFKIEISNEDDGQYTMHEKTQKWFWYAPENFGKEYDESDGTDCSQHPCFYYKHRSDTHASSIESGDFTGTDFDGSSESNYTRVGIKVFR